MFIQFWLSTHSQQYFTTTYNESSAALVLHKNKCLSKKTFAFTKKKGFKMSLVPSIRRIILKNYKHRPNCLKNNSRFSFVTSVDRKYTNHTLHTLQYYILLCP